MKRLIQIFLGLVLWSGLGAAPSAHATDAPGYRGFQIDDSRIRTFPNRDAIVDSVKEQINIVCAVGVPQDMMDFFRTVRFEVVPPGVIAPGNPGLYSARTKSIQVTSIVVTAGHKPIFLHELLHAYHDQRIPDGFRNSHIAGFYQDAKAIPAFAARSHMMQNDKEFFACSGTSYLFGVTAQEPFSREKVQKNQPAMFAYLQTLFGPNAGSYHGSLSSPAK